MVLGKQRGQILLIVVLAVIVASTVGLSIASRSITSLRSSTEEAESQKALAAAEAGIERAIQGSTTISISGDNSSNNSHYSTIFEQSDSSSFLINGGNAIPKDEGADVWFVKHKDNGDLDYSDYSSTAPNFLNLYWGSSSNGCSEAAIQAVVVTRNPSLLDSDPNKIKSYRYAYDACPTRRLENKFTSADTAGNFVIVGPPGMTFNNSTPVKNLAKDINGNEKIILMRVIPIYKDAVIGVNTCNPQSKDNPSCTPLSSQGYAIISTGTSGQASRKLKVFKGYPQTYLPYLSYGLFVAN